MTKNIRFLDIDLPKNNTHQEVNITQVFHKLIQGNNTLESVNLTVQEQTSIISILDSCESKPNIDSITLTCTQELSDSVRKHIKEYKKKNVFKSVKIYIILPKVKEEKGGCVIF